MSKTTGLHGAAVMNGSAAPAPSALIRDETARVCRDEYRDGVRAVVLTGSLAREEGTFVASSAGTTLLGDAEFFVIFRDEHALPPGDALTRLAGRIEKQLLARGVSAHVSVDGVQSRYLRGVAPSIFGYELRTCGVVVAGESDILGLVPAFSARDIPLEDGWRLLANRLVEQLESFDELVGPKAPLSAAAHYRTVKLYLDMGTSLLVFAGSYAPTYAQRAEALRQLRAPSLDLPFDLDRFVDDVAGATRWKLDARPAAEPAPREYWERALAYAEGLWHWELSRLTGGSSSQSVDELLRSWSARQPLRTRLRGWAYVARRHGWRASLAHAPRWLRTAVSASPRYRLYGAAAALVFALRRSRRPSVDPAQLREYLPLRRSGTGENDLRQLVTDVLTNYQQFLVGTRA